MHAETASHAGGSPAAGLPAHLPALDGVRGVAILLVLAHQLGLLETVSGPVGYLFRYTMGVGWVGVQMFFVLSGFLITGILLDTQKADNYFSGFYARRCLRIFPLYYGVLIVTFLVLPLSGLAAANAPDYGQHQIWFWLYLSNWSQPLGIGNGMFPHFWSLAVEEQFYLVWPLLLLRLTPRGCVRLCLAVTVLCVLSRVLLVWQGASGSALYEFTICRMDALALGGALAAALRVDGWRERLMASGRKTAMIAVVLGVLGAVTSHGYWTIKVETQLWGYTVVAMVFALLLASLVADENQPSSRLAGALRWPWLRSIGKVSYAMYIFHKPVHDYLGKPLLNGLGWPMKESILFNLIYISSGALLLWMLGMVSYHAFEKHFLRFKSRFPPRYPVPA